MQRNIAREDNLIPAKRKEITMDIKDVLSNLCYYDLRNPDCIYTDDEISLYKKEICFCDNCFKGKNKLAEEILRLRKIIVNNNIKI